MTARSEIEAIELGLQTLSDRVARCSKAEHSADRRLLWAEVRDRLWAAKNRLDYLA